MTSSSSRISDSIKEDHRQIENFYKVIVSSQDADEQNRFQTIFTWELARHTVGEELVVYPAIEKYVRDGVQAADKDRKEHQTVKEQLKKFQNMNRSDPQFIPTIQSLMNDLSKHIHDEETIDLVKLEEAITPEESAKLAKSFSRTKIFVPSRSHPSAPDKPPFETAVGLLMAPIDQLADLFRRWPEKGHMRNIS